MIDKALLIGKIHGRKFGVRWLHKFITFDFQLRSLLTHGNCADLKKDANKQLSNKMNNSMEADSQEFEDNNSSEYGIDET